MYHAGSQRREIRAGRNKAELLEERAIPLAKPTVPSQDHRFNAEFRQPYVGAATDPDWMQPRKTHVLAAQKLSLRARGYPVTIDQNEVALVGTPISSCLHNAISHVASYTLTILALITKRQMSEEWQCGDNRLASERNHQASPLALTGRAQIVDGKLPALRDRLAELASQSLRAGPNWLSVSLVESPRDDHRADDHQRREHRVTEHPLPQRAILPRRHPSELSARARALPRED